MTAQPSTINWNNVNSLTERAVSRRIVDQIFRSNPLIRRLRRNQRTESGGAFISTPLAYAEGPGGPFEGMQLLDVSEVEQITAALYNWKHYYVSITIRRSDELKNSGPRAFGNLLRSKLRIARKSMLNYLGQGLYSDGSDALAITGLRAMVTGTGQTYGNISKTNQAWWRSEVDSTTTTLTINRMRNLMGLLTEDADSPNLIATTQPIYNSYYNLLQPQQRFASSEMAKGGFTSIMFEGRPLVVDSHCPDNNMFMLNTEYLEWVAHRAEDMRFEPFRRPYRQAGRSAFIFWFGNLTASSCRFQGRFTALTG